MLRELVVLPAGEPFNAADPESSIFGAALAVDRVRRKMLTWGRQPGNASATLETEQAEVRSEPEVTLGSLGDQRNCAFGEALANLPRRVGVLIHAEPRIKRPKAQTHQAETMEDSLILSATGCRTHPPFTRFPSSYRVYLSH